MLIVIDARFLAYSEAKNYHHFTKEVLLQMAVQQSHCRFLFLVDKLFVHSIDLPANVTLIPVSRKPKNFLSYHWWYHIKLPLLLRKCKPSFFIGSYGLCSVYNALPQLLIVHDLSFLHKQASHPRHSFLFYKKNTTACLTKATIIATVSQSVKDELVKTYAVAAQKISVCGSSDYQLNEPVEPVNWQQKQAIKEQYTQGCEYFFYEANENTASQMMTVLKAFSIFKKWQRSNMKLVVMLNTAIALQQKEKLATYKFREDVVLVEHAEEAIVHSLLASAYVAIHTVLYEGFSAGILQGMAAGIPVLTYDTAAAKEMATDVALFATVADEQSLAAQMKLIYKDENLRSKLVEAGLGKAKQYSWAKTTDCLWQMVESIA